MKGVTREARKALEKARDSALLAVEVYNKPAVRFKSGAYISLMVIAWTSLFHAVFFKRKVKPFYREKGRRFVRIEGDFKFWQLDECLRVYFKGDEGNPVCKNLEFFIPLRNRIEHRSMPELDAGIFGECQAMLLNFDEVVELEFGTKYCLRESLSFSLQMFPSANSLVEAVKRRPGTASVLEFISRYRSTISSDVLVSSRYSFKAFLIQVANHKSEKALAIQFVHYDKLSEAEREQISHLVAMVKYKELPVVNPHLLKPREVVKRVQLALGDPKHLRGGKEVNKFNLNIHAACWKKYKIRPAAGSRRPEETDSRYCVYDRLHNDYGYTDAWVTLLTEKLRDSNEFDTLYKVVQASPNSGDASVSR